MSYLVRDGEGIKLVFEKPSGVRVSKNHTLWFLRDFSFSIGEDNPQFHFNGLEVIGVFDLDIPKHHANMMKMFVSHLRQYLEGKTLSAVEVLTPVKRENLQPSGGTHHTPIGEAIVKVFRHGDQCGQW